MTPFGLLSWNLMSFGLYNAAQTMQWYMDEALRGLDFVFAYIDDVLIASSDEAEHREHIRIVLERLGEFALSINPAKCVLMQPSVTHLGHVIDEHGTRPTEEKVAAIIEMPRPETVPGHGRCNRARRSGEVRGTPNRLRRDTDVVMGQHDFMEVQKSVWAKTRQRSSATSASEFRGPLSRSRSGRR